MVTVKMEYYTAQQTANLKNNRIISLLHTEYLHHYASLERDTSLCASFVHNSVTTLSATNGFVRLNFHHLSAV